MHGIDFHEDKILGQSTAALINPGFPYIAAPLDEFQKFADDVRSNYSGVNMNCDSDYGYCSFESDCEEVAATLPPLVFLLGPETRQQYYAIPAATYLFPEYDMLQHKVPHLCHLGVIGQTLSDIDYWVLGDAFLQNYYVAFDASQDEPYIGITLEVGSMAGITHKINRSKTATEVAIAVVAIGVLVCIGFGGCYCYMQKKSQREQNKTDLK